MVWERDARVYLLKEKSFVFSPDHFLKGSLERTKLKLKAP